MSASQRACGGNWRWAASSILPGAGAGWKNARHPGEPLNVYILKSGPACITEPVVK